jgi:hypothetical protein
MDKILEQIGLNKLMWGGAGVSVVLSILCFIFAINSESTFTTVILILVSLLFLALAGMVGYLAYVDTFKVLPGKKQEEKPLNYFLNANGKKKGLALEELTFEIIDKQMNNFIMDAWGTPVALWKNSVFSSEEEAFGKEGVFKILLAYKMLSDLQVHHSKKAWKMFYELPDVDFADIQECLVRNGDEELAKALNMYRLSGEASVGEAAAFLDENATYIQRRMLNYVNRKIELFNM